MKNKKTTSDYFKKVGVDLNTYKINPKKKFNKRTAPGLKKGSGGVADCGPGGVGESTSLLASINEAIEDVTDSEDANLIDKKGGDEGSADLDGADALDGEGENEDGNTELDFGEEDGVGGDPVTRYVPGAHLVYKRQSDVDAYEELWIFSVDPKNPTAHAKIEEQILAGTDIDPKSMASEDGAQTASVWHAGNAKYMHLTGLVN